MGKVACFLLLVAIQEQLYWEVESTTYKAAVVEYQPLNNRSATIEEITGGNVDAYIELLESLQNLDIIVYPEATITFGAFAPRREDYLRLSTLVPNATDDVVPCGSDNEYFNDYFMKLSCAARSASTYIVVNLMEKSQCVGSVCSQDRWNLYNTNVAFDRNGKVVARYRKFNLFGEYPLNSTEQADISTFTTDFNVTFGMFTCFDLLFETPALKLVRQGVRHIIFPTMWFSELPFLSALQAQNMWAVENDVVFLAAGANNPPVGSGGSGFYHGSSGYSDIGIIGEGGTRVYVKDIDKVATIVVNSDVETATTGNIITDEIAAGMDDFYFKLDNLSGYASELLNLTASSTETPVCHGEFCCNFKIKIKSSLVEGQNYYRYRMVAFSGVRRFDVMNGGVDVCGLVACRNTSIESCGMRFPKYGDVSWPVKFDEVTVTGKFANVDNVHQFPNTLLSSIRPMASSLYQWSNQLLEDDTVIERTIKLVKTTNRLMAFGIFGRDVSRDNFFSSANLCKADVVCLAVMSVVARFLSTS